MTDVIFLLLFALHVVGVVSWFGATLVFIWVIQPAVRQLDDDKAKMEFLSRVIPRFVRFTVSVSILTILAGFFLFDYISTSVLINLLPGWRLQFVYAGAILGFVAFVTSTTVLVSSSNKIQEAIRRAQSSAVNSDEMISNYKVLTRAQDAIKAGLSVSSTILLIVFILMVLGANF